MQENLPREPQQEMHALSGALKDLHGQVHQRLGIIEKRLAGPTTGKASDKLAQHRDDLIEARAELEAALDEVNSGDLENWEEIKSRTEEVIEEVTETLERTKDTSTSAVN
jgi:hypothetical protein